LLNPEKNIISQTFTQISSANMFKLLLKTLQQPGTNYEGKNQQITPLLPVFFTQSKVKVRGALDDPLKVFSSII
jgi:hypothetical protein